jgi:hypothetical protein
MNPVLADCSSCSEAFCAFVVAALLVAFASFVNISVASAEFDVRG